MSLFTLSIPESLRQDIHRIANALDSIEDAAKDVVSLLRLAIVGTPATGLKISQLVGGHTMPIIGQAPGESKTFVLTPIPANGQYQAGAVPQWTSGDADVSLAPSGDGKQVVATLAASSVLSSYGLTAQVTSSNGSPLVKTVSVPVLAGASVPATDLSIDQID